MRLAGSLAIQGVGVDLSGLPWQAALQCAASHPNDADVPELLERVRRIRRDAYLSAGRDILGWSWASSEESNFTQEGLAERGVGCRPLTF